MPREIQKMAFAVLIFSEDSVEKVVEFIGDHRKELLIIDPRNSKAIISASNKEKYLTVSQIIMHPKGPNRPFCFL